jgi:site-specific recombinase XerD
MSHPIPLTDPLSIAWLQWCINEGIPTNTTARRLATLRSMPSAGTATREDVEAWWAARTDHAPASRANDLANLRSFYRWCRRWEHRPPTDDPTHRIDSPKVPKGLPRPMSRADLNHLLDVLPPDMRRAAALGAWAGLRVSEAASQDWADIDLELNRIRVLGKGSKTRQVGLSVLLLDALLPNTGGNVVAAGGKPSSASVLQRRVNRAFETAGVHATFHQLRHRFGTIALANGANLLAVSRAMGHASVSTTAGYVWTSDAELDIIAAAVTR